MGQNGDGFFGFFGHRQVLARWARDARLSRTADLTALRKQRAQARSLRTQLDALLKVADDRLSLPVPGSMQFPKPHNADWSWRPELWRSRLPVAGISAVPTKSKLGDELTLFHDCTRSEITLRQLRNTREQDLAAYGMRLDVFRFDGSFLSVVLDLPSAACTGLTRQHILGIDMAVEAEEPIEIFVRLNVRSGPNTEQIVRELPAGRGGTAEFDLAYSGLNEKIVEKAWLDVIFEGPEMNQVVVRDLTVSRWPRAEF